MFTIAVVILVAGACQLVSATNVDDITFNKLVDRVLSLERTRDDKITKLETEMKQVKEENQQLKTVQILSKVIGFQDSLKSLQLALDHNPSDEKKMLSPMNDEASGTGTLQTAAVCPRACRGLPGRDGRDGKPGNDGKPGRDGKPGDDGKPGRDGRPGTEGKPGKDGRDGIPGQNGKGLQGPPGPTGPSVTDDRIKQLIKEHGLPPNTTVGGSVYTRWGRTKCGASSKLLYEGYTAGSWFEHKGGASNYICLPHKPQWGNYQDGFQNSGPNIYGTEYQMGGFSNDPFRKTNNGGKTLKDHDAPCAVCYTQGRTSHVMIPAWKTCPVGWTREYHGYLVAQHNSQSRTESVCLDEAPEAVAGGASNTNGALFYVAEVKCHYAIPCPQYVEGRELTCVVCSK